MQRGRLVGHRLGRLGQLLGRLEFGVGVDDPGPPVAGGLRLAGHRPLHGLRQRHVLDLHPVDLHAPAQRRTVDHHFQALVELLPVGEQVVEVALADDGAQRGLGDLGDREAVVLDLDHRVGGVHDLEVDHRVHPDRHVVVGDALLGGHRHRDDLHVDLTHPVDTRDDHGEPRLARGRHQPAQPQHDTPFVLLDHPRPRHHVQRARRSQRDPGRHQFLDHHGPLP